MSRALLILAATFASVAASSAGCAPRAAQPAEAESITSTRFAPERGGGAGFDESRAVAASALVFDPPVALDEPPLNLARADRQPGAFFGYEEGFVEYYQLTVDDRQLGLSGLGYGGFGGGGSGWGRGGFAGSGWYDRYERRAVSQKTGVIRR